MKKDFFLILTLCITICKANAANTHGYNYKLNAVNNAIITHRDTTKYLRDSVINHKEKFQHKELNVMLNTLHLKVKSYMTVNGQKIGSIKYIILYFDDSKFINKKIPTHVPIPKLIVYFEEDVSYRDAFRMFTKSNGDWLDEEKEYYGKRLVKNVEGLK